MVEKDLEARVKKLEEIVNKQNNDIERLEAYRDIQNVMGKYMIQHNHGPLIAESPKYYALKSPGVAVEICDWGLFEGPEMVKKLYREGHGDTSKPKVGDLVEHDLTTPVIEVAKDCKTAKATWFCPGFFTLVIPGEKPKARWRWHKIGAAFIKEDGQWKLWKYHVYSTFICDFYKSWTDEVIEGWGFMKDLNPKPCTFKDNPYRIDGVRTLDPAPPEAYDTWDKPLDWMP
jgi:hypothetical protein